MFGYLISETPECLPYFSTDFKIGFAIFSAKGFSTKFRNFQVFTTFVKNESISSATLMS